MGDRSIGRWRVSSMRLRITLLAASATAVALVIAGLLLIRSVEDTQVAAVRDRAQDSLDLAAERLRHGDGLGDALTGLSSTVVVTDDERGCFISNPIGHAFVMGCVSEGDDDGRPGAIAGVDDEHVVMIGGEVVELDASLADGLFAGSYGLIVDVDAVVDEELIAGSQAEIGGPVIEFDDDMGVSGGRVIPRFDRDRLLLDDPAVVRTDRLATKVATDRYGELSITALAPANTVVRGLESVGAIVWILFPALVLLAAASAWWLAGRTLRPVEAIRSEADEIGATSLDRRVPQPAADDEIGRLATTMNAMLDRLERGAQQQRQFISDASHELRSPVAAIRTDLEVALEESDAADWPATATAVLAEEARLDALIGDLLILAADDEGGGEVGNEVVDLNLVVAEAAARRRRIPTRVTIEPDRTFVVQGSASRLERALANLLDNAARHGDARVDIAIVADGERVIVHVDDDGPGIDPADRDRVFERFTRLDEGRARDQGGAGLGLAVARAIVERHGGSIAVGDSPLGGARFTVDLPRS